MYDTLTPRWAIFLMGMVAGVLGVVPFIAYWKGPEIRARSPFSRILMAEEKARVAAAEKEQAQRESGDTDGDVEMGSIGRVGSSVSDAGRGAGTGTGIEGATSRDHQIGGIAEETAPGWTEQVRRDGEAQMGFEKRPTT